MMRLIVAAGLAASFLLSPSAFAATSKEKMETCKFGADDQKLDGRGAQGLHVEVHVQRRLAARQAGHAAAEAAVARSRLGGGAHDPGAKRHERRLVLAGVAIDQIPVLAL